MKHDYDFTAEAVTTLSERRLAGTVRAENAGEAAAAASVEFHREFSIMPSGVSVRLVPIDIMTWGGQ